MRFDSVQQELAMMLALADSNGVVALDAPAPGPTVSVCALTHGNEITGVVTAAQILRKIQAGTQTLVRGRLQFLLANYEILQLASGFEHLQRHRGVDLNRIWGQGQQPVSADSPGSNEFAVRERLLPAICASDCLIDLHSTSLPSTPIGILLGDSDTTCMAVAEQLHVPYVITNINAFINGTAMIDRHQQEQQEQRTHSARTRYPSFSLVIEAGQHFDFSTVKTNIDNVIRLLQHTGLLKGPLIPVPGRAVRLCVYQVGLASAADQRVDWVYTKQPAGFDALADGTHICNLDGEAVYAVGDSFVVMPQLRARNVGQELFYVARVQ